MILGLLYGCLVLALILLASLRLLHGRSLLGVLLRLLVVLGRILLILRLKNLLKADEGYEQEYAHDHTAEDETDDPPYDEVVAGLLEPSLVQRFEDALPYHVE